MGQFTNQPVKHIGLFLCLVVGGLLVAHSINAFVADALYVVPDQQAGADDQGSIRPVALSPAQYMEDIRSSGLFALPATPQSSAQHDDPGAPVARASLGAASKIRLIGVVMGDRQGFFAIVEELASKKQVLFRLKDQIPDVGEVADIQRNGMAVRRGNLEEWLELEPAEKPVTAGALPPSSRPSMPPQTSSGSPIRKVVDRREVELAMSDLPKLLTQARAVPNMVNGTLNGFRIDYMAPASFYEKIGVQTGDVLQRVNGVDIRDPGTVLNLLQQLKNEQVVKLDIVRNDQRSTITYELR